MRAPTFGTDFDAGEVGDMAVLDMTARTSYDAA